MGIGDPHTTFLPVAAGSDECLWMVATDRSKIWVKRWMDISHFTLKRDKSEATRTLAVHMYEEEGHVAVVTIQVDAGDEGRLREEMKRHAQKMGNARGQAFDSGDCLRRLTSSDCCEDAAAVVLVTNLYECNVVYIHSVSLEVGSSAVVDRAKVSPGQTAIVRGTSEDDGDVRLLIRGTGFEGMFGASGPAGTQHRIKGQAFLAGIRGGYIFDLVLGR